MNSEQQAFVNRVLAIYERYDLGVTPDQFFGDAKGVATRAGGQNVNGVCAIGAIIYDAHLRAGGQPSYFSLEHGEAYRKLDGFELDPFISSEGRWAGIAAGFNGHYVCEPPSYHSLVEYRQGYEVGEAIRFALAARGVLPDTRRMFVGWVAARDQALAATLEIAPQSIPALEIVAEGALA